MTALEVIRKAAASELIDEDGERVVLVLKPGMSASEIADFEAELGFRPPQELLELLSDCGGLDGALDNIDFTGRTCNFAHEDIFPRCIPFAGDGYGNFWVLDSSPGDLDVAPVFFACHDPPVILYQSPSLAVFLAEVVRMDTPPNASLVNDVHEDRLFHVWRKNPGTLSVAEAALGDDDLRKFAATLDERYTIVDLRRPEVGTGFSWGRYGPETEIRRFGDLRIFAYARGPESGLRSCPSRRSRR